LRPLLNWLSQTEQELGLPKGLPKKLNELETEVGASGKEVPVLGSRDKALEIARKDPAATAQLAKEWLSEGE
jgi:phosphomevalonate kinase